MTEHKKRTKPVETPTEEMTTPAEGVETQEAPELAALKEELTAVQEQCKEYSEGWQRERADFLNFRKRIERDQAQLNQVVTSNIIRKYLSVTDDMERALANRPQGAESQEWWNGVELIYRKLTGILESEGVQVIPAEGEMFDPALHEAITHEDNTDVESGRVIAVVQKGYRIGDRIIRPTLVRVAR
ncbi:MAG: nucleotide exchange factor GrpE [Bellilinea sp.]